MSWDGSPGSPGGHSIGGMIAIELARQRCRQLGGVISLEGWTHHQVLGQAFSGKVDTTLSEELERQRLQARGQTLCRLSQSQIAAFRSIWQRWDGLPILQSTSVPVLEVWGGPQPAPPQPPADEDSGARQHPVALGPPELPIRSRLERPQEVAGAIDRFVFSLEVS